MGPVNPFVLLVRRVVAALAVLACSAPALLVGLAGSADATSVAGNDLAPTDIFLGTVVKHHPEPKAPTGGRPWTYVVSVKTVYKGSVSTRRVTVTTPAYRRPCVTTPLDKGKDYVFKLEMLSSTGLTAGACRQIVASDAATLAKYAQAYPDAHDPVRKPVAPPTPPDPVITALPAAVPASFTQLALPGVGLVVVGLLGLVVARRMARPRAG